MLYSRRNFLGCSSGVGALLLSHSVDGFSKNLNDNASASSSTTAVINSHGVNLIDFGARGDGIFDDAQALQNAIDYLGKGGGVISIPSGRWYWKSVPKLPAELDGRLVIAGRESTIVLSVSGPRVFDFNKTHDNQNFRHYEISNFDIDAAGVAGVGGYHHVLIGSRCGGHGNEFLGRFNARDLVFKNINIYNIPSRFNEKKQSYHSVVFLAPFHRSCDEEVRNEVIGITFHRVVAHGGDGGFQINGFCQNGSSANIYFDDINLIDCAHYLQVAPAFYACSNIHIGGFGYGGRCVVKNFRGENSGDNGIEINGMQNSRVDNIFLKGFVNYGLYVHNYHEASDVASQQLTVGSHNYELTYTGSRAFSFGSENSISHVFGHLKLGHMQVMGKGWRSAGSAIHLAPSGPGTKLFSSCVVESLRFFVDLSGQNINGKYYPSVLTCKLAKPALLHIKSIEVEIVGVPVFGYGAKNLYPRIFEYLGNVNAVIENVVVVSKVHFDDLWINYFSSEGGMSHVVLREHRYESSARVTTGFVLRGHPLDAVHKLRLSHVASVDVDFNISDQTQKQFIELAEPLVR